MASNFTNFLLSIGENPQQLEAFKQDPQAVMTQAGLTPTEQNMILTGDVLAVRQHLFADPDLKYALGLPANQSLPARIPMFVFPPTP